MTDKSLPGWRISCANPLELLLIVKMPSIHPLVALLVGVSLTLTGCQYLYNYNDSGPYGGTFTPYRTSGRRPIGDLAASTLGSNRDHYYYVIRGEEAGRRYRYCGSPPYASATNRSSGSLPVSYYLHPYYSNRIHSSPYYSRSSSSIYSTTNRPWGGGYGFGQPFNWGTGLGLGSYWF